MAATTWNLAGAIAKARRLVKHAVLGKYVKFCLVGGSGAAVDMLILGLLASPNGLNWNLTLSKVVAAEIAILNNFVWNDLWTFHGLGEQQSRRRARLIRLGKFNLICVVGIGLSVLLLNGQVSVLGLNLYLANFISIVLVSVWNFALNLKYGWRMQTNPSRSMDGQPEPASDNP